MALSKKASRIEACLVLGLLMVNVISLSGSEWNATRSANGLTEPKSQVAVLVDKSVAKQTYYDYYVGGVWKWLEWWKMDFEEIDVASVNITRPLLNNYNVIVIPQFNLAENGHLDFSNLQTIHQAVYEDGLGLVQADADLESYLNIWPEYAQLFNVTTHNWVSTTNKMNLRIINNTHFITEIYRNGTEMNCLFPNEGSGEDLWKESDLAFENVTVGSEAITLAVMPYQGRDYPAIIVKVHGAGRVVLSTFSTGRESLGKGGYDGFGERVNFKTTSGMNGLLWRSIAWTAKKPFAFMGMPPFLGFRVDDVSVMEMDDYDTSIYIEKLMEYGFFVNLYIFQNYTRDLGAAYQSRLRDYYTNGSAHIAPHARAYYDLIYYRSDRRGNPVGEQSTATLATYFTQLDADYATWNITASAYIVPHFSYVGENAVSFLEERGWIFSSTINWIPYSAGEMYDCWIWDPDWRRPAHIAYADENNTIFSVCVDFPVGDPDIDFQDCLMEVYDPAKASSQILCSMEHGLADLFWGDAFTHEQYAIEFSASDWDKILSSVVGNISKQYPFVIKASKEHIARYVLNRGPLSISDYAYAANTLTLNLSGTSNLPLALYLFTDQKIASYSGMLDYFRSYGDDGYMVWIPPYSTNHQVTITLADTETEPPHIHFTTANVTSTYSTTSQLTIDAEPLWKHDKPLYPFEINCTGVGQPRNITMTGTSIDFVYDNTSKIARFNATFSSGAGRVVVGWGDVELHLEAGWNMISFPVIPSDPRFSNIFSSLSSYQVLTWDGSGYVTPSTAEAGWGYWVFVLSATTLHIAGELIESYERNLPAGWSTIGSIYNATIDADTVFPDHYELLTWTGTGYVSVTSIEPGMGYWVAVLTSTHITVQE